MTKIIKSEIGSVQSINGSLAVYVNNQGVVMLKDMYNNVQPLVDFLNFNEVILVLEANKSIKPLNGKNILDEEKEYSVIGGGDYNTNRGNYSVISGGCANTTSCESTTVAGGHGNNADADYSFVGGGKNNRANGEFSSVLAGKNNNIKEFKNSHIIGSDIEADSENTTFFNQISIKNCPKSPKNLPKGAVYSEKGVLKIVD
jgi:hypothetical protein